MLQPKKETLIISEQKGMELPTDPLDVYEALSLLEKENERLLDTHKTAKCVLILYDKKQVEIFRQALSLPYEGKIEEVLRTLLEGGNYTLKEQKKLVENTKSISKTANIYQILAIGISLIALVLGIYGFTAKVENNNLQKEFDHLETELSDQKKLSDNQGEVDVYVRYFLPNLFSDNKDNMENFVSDDIFKEVQNQKGQLLSVMQEKIDQTKDGFLVSYVCTIREDENSKIKRITFVVQEDSDARFGYTLVTGPKIEDY